MPEPLVYGVADKSARVHRPITHQPQSAYASSFPLLALPTSYSIPEATLSVSGNADESSKFNLELQAGSTNKSVSTFHTDEMATVLSQDLAWEVTSEFSRICLRKRQG